MLKKIKDIFIKENFKEKAEKLQNKISEKEKIYSDILKVNRSLTLKIVESEANNENLKKQLTEKIVSEINLKNYFEKELIKKSEEISFSVSQTSNIYKKIESDKNNFLLKIDSLDKWNLKLKEKEQELLTKIKILEEKIDHLTLEKEKNIQKKEYIELEKLYSEEIFQKNELLQKLKDKKQIKDNLEFENKDLKKEKEELLKKSLMLEEKINDLMKVKKEYIELQGHHSEEVSQKNELLQELKDKKQIKDNLEFENKDLKKEKEELLKKSLMLEEKINNLMKVKKEYIELQGQHSEEVSQKNELLEKLKVKEKNEEDFKISKEVIRLNKINLALENYSENKINKIKTQKIELEKELKNFIIYSENLEKEIDKYYEPKISKIEIQKKELEKEFKKSKIDSEKLEDEVKLLNDQLELNRKFKLKQMKNNQMLLEENNFLTKENKQFKYLIQSLIKYAEIKLNKIELENSELIEELELIEKKYTEKSNLEIEYKKQIKILKKNKELGNDIIIRGEWADKQKYTENKKSLLELLKTFDEIDFKEMYLEGKKLNILN
ncbi:MAG: hypothetical protein ACRCYT_03900, partial [Cetobacterium sp.]